METHIYRQTLGGSYSNIYIMPIDAPFPEGARQDLTIHTHTYMHTHTNKMAITQACFCLSLLEVEKSRVWKWVSKRKEAQDEVCYSASPRGVRTTRRPGESAHCPHMPHTNTHTHTLDRKQALPQQNPICCNICPKKSENECKLRLFSPALPHYLTLVIQSPSAVMGVHSTPLSMSAVQHSRHMQVPPEM